MAPICYNRITLSPGWKPLEHPHLDTELCLQVDWLRATIHLLMSRGAVAVSLASCAVEKITAIAWSQNVVRCSKGVAPFSVS